MRTPLHPPLFDTPPDTPERIQSETAIKADQVECEVHRTWQFDSLQGEA